MNLDNLLKDLFKKEEKVYSLTRAVGFIGENNSGKCTIASLIAKEFNIRIYDFDEIEKLTKLYNKAKKGVGLGIVVFPREKQSFLYLKENPMDLVLITLPHRHNILVAKELVETAHRCNCRVIGVIVNFAANEKEGLGVAKELGLELIEWIPYVKKLDSWLIKNDIESFKVDSKLKKKLESIVKFICGEK